MSTVSPGAPILYHGTCDASAAVLLGDRLVVANDEDDWLRVYDLERGGDPLQRIDLFADRERPGGDRESDLEGAAVIGGRTWWIGSHGRNRKGKERPNRRVLIATRISQGDDQIDVEVEAVHHGDRSSGLLGSMLALPELGPLLSETEPLAPKTGGLNIEGLAARDGALVIGLRSPLVSSNAPVIFVRNPNALLGGSAPLELDSCTIDLGGRGVRSLSDDPGGDGFIVVAGTVGEGDDFALYRWSGSPSDAPQPIDRSLDELRVESILPLPGGRLLALSDDGSVRRGGTRCKDLPESERRFRGLALTLP